ncbi:DegT/DnrJ/EryC1/StrS aminotransferase family protein, partial [Candidatus Roizmanbacteria bacterium]|nr:DegT/DnrJ/EryC1/StrS aminotransferase family protein [Candidatus Roizmanbacteria bacterium]
MISTDFAPNESWDDAWLSLKLLIQPWRWKYGQETEIVKEKIKKLLNVTSYKLHVTCFLSGRSALYYLLKSLNLPKNSKVIVQAFTCEAVVLPIIANKLKPVYIDIENETYSMDLNSLTRKLVNSKTDSVKVLILQHTFGLTPKFRKEIITLAQKNKLIVIEDLAHGFSPSIFRTDNRLPITDHYFLLSFGR